tara:strand:- start:648 stop:800 length:153 start_codon:yes stop_codon:yes gene_type:complete
MKEILNPFDNLDPLSIYQKFQKIIMNIKDKKDKNKLLEIGRMLEKKLKEF